MKKLGSSVASLVVFLSVMLFSGMASAGILGSDPATAIAGADADIKSFGTAMIGLAIIVTVFGFVFSLLHRK